MKKLLILLLIVTFMSACNNAPSNENRTVALAKEDKVSTVEQKVHKSKEATSIHSKDVSSQNGDKTANLPKPVYKVSDETWSIIPIDKKEKANKKMILLTIDDAPDKYALEMAEILHRLDAKAIFFVNGHFLETEKQKEALREIHSLGFVIGNHTYSHPYLPDLPEAKQKEEIIRVNDMVEEITGERPVFFRAPNGANTEYTRKLAKAENMVLMNWSFGYDWQEDYMDKAALTDITLHSELLHDGANILMHDRKWTAEALEDIVTGLRKQGYDMLDPNLIKTE